MLQPVTFSTLLATAGFCATVGWAEPGLILDLGAKFDKSLNEAAFTGAQAWVADTGGSYREVQLQAEAQRQQTIQRMAERGLDPVVVLGFANATTLARVAPRYPETRFAIIDVPVNEPNVRSVVFAEQEGAYLMGLLAAMATESGTIGFVGGMDIPLVRKIACGYRQGAQAANPEIVVIQAMAGTTPAAWNDPVTGSELAKAQMNQGADVIFAAAGGTSLGALQAVADAGELAIGMDFNLNYLHPGTMLTSLLKRMDLAVYRAFEDAAQGNFTTGTVTMDLANGGIDFAIDEFNANLLTPEMQTAAENAKRDIAEGRITVHDYTRDDFCPSK